MSKYNSKNSWFKFINTDTELKKRLTKSVDLKKEINPYKLNSLEEEEKKIAEKYYDKKIPIENCSLFFEQLKERTKYLNDEKRNSDFLRVKCSIPHIGQRKLLMTEVWFLSKYNLQNIKKRKNPPVMVYPGAAQGLHIMYLAKLFPNVEFHLYDMTRYDYNLRDNNIRPKNVTLHQQLFLDEESTFWAEKRKNGREIYLVSDIRALSKSDNTIEKKENVVNVDNLLQYKWIEEIRPVSAMIKWRIPFTNGESFRYKYLDGEILLQPWGGVSTTETRLIVECPPKNKPYKYRTIKNTIYEEKLAAFNNSQKLVGYFNHPIKCSGYSPYDKHEKSIDNSGLGMDHCWNCSSELLIWCLYLGLDKKIIINGKNNEIYDFMKNNNKQLLKLFNDTTRSICRPLQINCHGLLPYKTHKEKNEHFSNMENPDRKRFYKDLNNKNKNKKNLKCFYKYEKIQEVFFTHKSDKENGIKEEQRRQKKKEEIGDFFKE